MHRNMWYESVYVNSVIYLSLEKIAEPRRTRQEVRSEELVRLIQRIGRHRQREDLLSD